MCGLCFIFRNTRHLYANSRALSPTSPSGGEPREVLEFHPRSIKPESERSAARPLSFLGKLTAALGLNPEPVQREDTAQQQTVMATALRRSCWSPEPCAFSPSLSPRVSPPCPPGNRCLQGTQPEPRGAAAAFHKMDESEMSLRLRARTPRQRCTAPNTSKYPFNTYFITLHRAYTGHQFHTTHIPFLFCPL